VYFSPRFVAVLASWGKRSETWDASGRARAWRGCGAAGCSSAHVKGAGAVSFSPRRASAFTLQNAESGERACHGRGQIRLLRVGIGAAQ
jgi:hypothetical protein